MRARRNAFALILPVFGVLVVSQSPAYSASDAAALLERMRTPPVIERLVIEATGGERKRYFLLIYDSGDFVSKVAERLEDLDSEAVVSGVRAAGRFGDTVWALADDGFLTLTDLYDPVIETSTDEARHSQTLLLSDTNSRLDRSFITLGIRGGYLVEETYLNDGSFSIVGPYDRQDGRVWLDADSLETIHVNYTSGSLQEDAIRMRLYHTLRLGPDGIPRIIENWNLDEDGNPTVSTFQLRVLEIETSTESLPRHLLRPDYHFREQFRWKNLWSLRKKVLRPAGNSIKCAVDGY